MGTRIVTTPVFRASYVNLLEPKETQNGAWCYEITMIFEPNTDLENLKAIVREAMQEKWKGSPPKTGVRSPFRRGEWKSESYPQGFDLDKYPEYEGKIIVSARAYTTKLADGSFDKSRKPGVCGPDPAEIFNPQTDPLYSGMYGRASVSAYVPKVGEPSVALGLHNFQKCYDGDPLGASNGRPENDFDVFVQPTQAGYHDDLLGI